MKTIRIYPPDALVEQFLGCWILADDELECDHTQLATNLINGALKAGFSASPDTRGYAIGRKGNLLVMHRQTTVFNIHHMMEND